MQVPHDELLIAAIKRDQKRLQNNQPTATNLSTTLQSPPNKTKPLASLVFELYSQIKVSAAPSRNAVQSAPLEPRPNHQRIISLNSPSRSPIAPSVSLDTSGGNHHATVGAELSKRVFVCEHLACGRPFARAEHLRRHQQSHKNEKPHACTICNKRLSRKDNLQAHVSKTPPANYSLLPLPCSPLVRPCSFALISL